MQRNASKRKKNIYKVYGYDVSIETDNDYSERYMVNKVKDISHLYIKGVSKTQPFNGLDKCINPGIIKKLINRFNI